MSKWSTQSVEYGNKLENDNYLIIRNGQSATKLLTKGVKSSETRSSNLKSLQ